MHSILNNKKCLIIYSGQSRFLDTSIRLHSLATKKFSDMQFDVMLSTWQEDTSEKDIQALNEWKHGETYIRLPMHNDWADYNPKVKVFNGMKMLLSKSIALNYVLDLPHNYDFIILTRTDYHVPCITQEDFSFYNRVYKNTSKNMTSVFDGQYCWKMTGWELLINDNFVWWANKKRELIRNVSSGGFSSKISFFSHLIEEMRIRFNNKQNVFLIILIFLNSFLKKIFKKN